jgi:hypothetical protein
MDVTRLTNEFGGKGVFLQPFPWDEGSKDMALDPEAL